MKKHHPLGFVEVSMSLEHEGGVVAFRAESSVHTVEADAAAMAAHVLRVWFERDGAQPPLALPLAGVWEGD